MTSELIIHRLSTGESTVIHASEEIFEAPNWSPDGSWLLINSGGRLYRLPPAGGEPRLIDTGEQDKINNDHCISPDGRTIYFSNGDGHLYAVPAEGGDTRRITNDHGSDFQHYLHGVSPDGTTLAYIGVAPGPGGARTSNVLTIPAAGGADTQLTDLSVQNDGCEYTPDGRRMMINSELAAESPGHAQLFEITLPVRMSDGSDLRQLTFDERVNWFPHPSPDGAVLLYLSYPPGTQGHPADKDVILRTLPLVDGSVPEAAQPVDVVAFRGGQGTINVNSWAPDSDQFAYVSYPD
ncbi:biopolymer transporter Tol [Microlunatus sp. Gsoil 973]|uniref:biopolymer transporter Tol n=1 Tax=Microlunatus sp. Gsoil 973 TaxID=2672569 RepID=UPI001E5A0DC4|nr:biopolymer transporter Tol [Microlunatus sp. Gsoil 973]